ncbi:MAG: hypothetical protein J4F46_04485 [Dehalococcoidia bacterium]|nr:hypothetical protein [Dehalococcoidia bacterium]
MSPSTAAWVAIWAHIVISILYLSHVFRSLEEVSQAAVTGFMYVAATIGGIATGIVIIWSDQNNGKYKAAVLVMVGIFIGASYFMFFTIAYIVPALLFLGAALWNVARKRNSS